LNILNKFAIKHTAHDIPRRVLGISRQIASLYLGIKMLSFYRNTPRGPPGSSQDSHQKNMGQVTSESCTETR
jgi:hypothetical protein